MLIGVRQCESLIVRESKACDKENNNASDASMGTIVRNLWHKLKEHLGMIRVYGQRNVVPVPCYDT